MSLNRQATELEEVIVEIGDIDDAECLFNDYELLVARMKDKDIDYPYDQVVRFMEITSMIELQLPYVQDEVFQQYMIFLRLESICLEVNFSKN